MPEMSKLDFSRNRWPSETTSGSFVAPAQCDGRVDVGVAGGGEGDADRVVDRARCHLLVTDEAGEDRQAGGIGGGEALGATVRAVEIPDRAPVGLPALVLFVGEPAVHLVELAVGVVEADDVAVALAVLAALDRRVERDLVLAVVGLALDLELGLDWLGVGADDRCTGCRTCSATRSLGAARRRGCPS